MRKLTIALFVLLLAAPLCAGVDPIVFCAYCAYNSALGHQDCTAGWISRSVAAAPEYGVTCQSWTTPWGFTVCQVQDACEYQTSSLRGVHEEWLARSQTKELLAALECIATPAEVDAISAQVTYLDAAEGRKLVQSELERRSGVKFTVVVGVR